MEQEGHLSQHNSCNTDENNRHSSSWGQCPIDEDPDNWKDEGQVNSCQLLLVVFSLVMYIFDVITDVKVAVDHYVAGDHLWSLWTLVLTFVPCVFMQLISAWWFKEDKLLTPKVVLLHVALIGPCLRYVWIIRDACSIRNNKQSSVNHFKHLASQKLDCAMLSLFLAFMEDAPQLVLQMYIKTTLKQHYIKLTNIRDLWLLASLFLSLISLTWSLINYYKNLRCYYRVLVQVSGLISIFFWRFFTISSRVITLALFASLYRGWFFVLFGCHYILMLYFVWRQNISFFPEHPIKQKFLKLLFAYVFFFSYFSIEGQRTRKWAITFYTIIGLQNASLIFLWYFQQNSFTNLYSMFVLVYVLVAFLLGVALMSLYYAFMHPSRILEHQGGCSFHWHSKNQRKSRKDTVDSCFDQTHIMSGVALVAQYLSVV